MSNKVLNFREWLISGGSGHEDGEAGIRACTLPLESAIEMVEEYLEFLRERQASVPDCFTCKANLAAGLKCGECGRKVVFEASVPAPTEEEET